MSETKLWHRTGLVLAGLTSVAALIGVSDIRVQTGFLIATIMLATAAIIRAIEAATPPQTEKREAE